MRLRRLLVTLAIGAAATLSPLAVATPAYACGYFSGYEDCPGGSGGNKGGGKPLGWDLKNPDKPYIPIEKGNDLGRNGGFDWGKSFNGNNDCILLCGEGDRQRTFNDPGPLFPRDSYPKGWDYNRSCGPMKILEGKC